MRWSRTQSSRASSKLPIGWDLFPASLFCRARHGRVDLCKSFPVRSYPGGRPKRFHPAAHHRGGFGRSQTFGPHIRIGKLTIALVEFCSQILDIHSTFADSKGPQTFASKQTFPSKISTRTFASKISDPKHGFRPAPRGG